MLARTLSRPCMLTRTCTRVSITSAIMLTVAVPVRRVLRRSKSRATRGHSQLNSKSNGSHQSLNLKHYTLTHMSTRSLNPLKWYLLTSTDRLQLAGSPQNLIYIFFSVLQFGVITEKYIFSQLTGLWVVQSYLTHMRLIYGPTWRDRSYRCEY